MNDSEIVDAVTSALIGATTSKNDGNWGEIFFNADLKKDQWEPVHPDAACFSMPECSAIPRNVRAVFICSNGTVYGRLG